MKPFIKFTMYAALSGMCIMLAGCGNETSSSAGESAKSSSSAEEVTTAVSTTVTETETTVKTTAKTTPNTTAKTTVKPTEAVKKTTAAPETEEEEIQTEAETEPEEEEPVQAAGSFDASDLYAYYSGYSLTVNQDASTLPAAQSMESAPSCISEGEDKIFHYGDMDVYTYPIGGVDYIYEITLYSSSASTAKGLTVGMTLDDAKAMYGEGSGDDSMYSWYSGNSYMYVTASGGTITSIGLALQV